jgi:hypothetical protein
MPQLQAAVFDASGPPEVAVLRRRHGFLKPSPCEMIRRPRREAVLRVLKVCPKTKSRHSVRRAAGSALQVRAGAVDANGTIVGIEVLEIQLPEQIAIARKFADEHALAFPRDLAGNLVAA